MADDAEVATLSRELQQLRGEVAALKQSISDARGRVKLSMREQVCCPNCGARRIAHFERIPDFGYGAVFDLGLGVDDRGVWRGKHPVAPLEAYVCTECGLVEMRLQDTGVFATESEHVSYRILTSEDPGAGPYR
jgi:predicted RNA-binding Zn-ribbon protein involved in translation (DUF1610 family)